MARVIGGLLSGLAIGMVLFVLAVTVAGDDDDPASVSPDTVAPTVQPGGLPRLEDAMRPALQPYTHGEEVVP